jgi:hypothetical protein
MEELGENCLKWKKKKNSRACMLQCSTMELHASCVRGHGTEAAGVGDESDLFLQFSLFL